MSDTSTVELAARGSIISIMSLCANVKQQTSFIDLGAKRKTSSQSDTKCSFLQPGGKNVGPGVILLRVHSQGSSNYVSVCISQRQHKNNNSFHSQSGSLTARWSRPLIHGPQWYVPECRSNKCFFCT